VKEHDKPDLKVVSSTGELRPPKLTSKRAPITSGIKCPRYLSGRRRELWSPLGLAKAEWLLAPFDEGLAVMIVVLLDELLRDPEKMKASKVAVLRACLADAGLIPRTRRRLQRANPWTSGAA
jgi:hypothetical protein